MKILPSGNWSATWLDYEHRGPATTYYRKRDIVRALRHYGYTGTESPTTELNPYTDGDYFVCQNVAPYRVVYDN
jgi:hypothetical protein